MSAVDPSLIERIIRDDVRAMGAYHVPESHGLVKLDAMENPYRLPPELRAQLAARLGEVAAAFVVLRAGTQASSEELIEWCKGRCANFKVPRYLRLVQSFDDIGMTGSSKVQKNKLRDYAIREFGLT